MTVVIPSAAIITAIRIIRNTGIITISALMIISAVFFIVVNMSAFFSAALYSTDRTVGIGILNLGIVIGILSLSISIRILYPGVCIGSLILNVSAWSLYLCAIIAGMPVRTVMVTVSRNRHYENNRY